MFRDAQTFKTKFTKMKKTLFQNIRVIDSFSNTDAQKDVLIGDTLILGIEDPYSINNLDFTVIKSPDNAILIPGIIDLRVESKDPGETHTDNLETLLKSAAKSGITTLACLPNTDPVVDDTSMVESLSRRAKSLNLSKLMIYGAASIGLDDKKMSELGLLKNAGVVGFTNGNKPIYNPLLMKRILSYSTMLDLPIVQHADIPELSSDTEATESEISTRLGLRGVPSITEAMLIERDIHLIKLTKSKYHVSHISTKEGVKAIEKAKDNGLNVTCDTSPPYMLLNDLSLSNYDTRFKLSPPLRSEEDRCFIEESLENGVIDAISSDHSPQNRDSKLLPFSLSKAGSLGMETLLSSTISLVKSNRISIKTAIKLLTLGPSKILSLDAGKILKGSPADLTIIDIEKSWIVKGDDMLSLSSNTCFEGMPMQGKILSCWKDGIEIYQCN